MTTKDQEQAGKGTPPQAETKEAKGKQIVPREILENKTKISEQILDIEKNIQKIDDDLKEEKKAQNERRINLEKAVKKKQTGKR